MVNLVVDTSRSGYSHSGLGLVDAANKHSNIANDKRLFCMNAGQ